MGSLWLIFFCMFHKNCCYPSDCLIIRRDKDSLQGTVSFSLFFVLLNFVAVFFSPHSSVSVVGVTARKQRNYRISITKMYGKVVTSVEC